MDVILRNNAVEQARAGDRMVFTGCLIVAPDVGAMAAPGEKVVMRTGEEGGRGAAGDEDVLECASKPLALSSSLC